MKKYIQFFAIAILFALFTGCTESDDEFFASKVVTANGLIAVNLSGNTVAVSTAIPRLLPQTGGNPFDLYLTTTSNQFFFNYTLEKKNANNVWELVAPSGYNVVTSSGSNQFGDYIAAICQLDALETTYEYDTTIAPIATGDYRLTVDNEVVSIDSKNAVTVIIKTTAVGDTTNNVLEFTVN